MKPLGGYFEWELSASGMMHQQAIHVNTGRGAFEYILRTGNFETVFLPDYCCDILYRSVLKLGLKCRLYAVNESLEILSLPDEVPGKAAFVYVNYFGLKGQYISKLVSTINNLVIDNAQAFFDIPPAGISCFYSARKFFGVPDGGLLFSASNERLELNEDNSAERCAHLLTRLEKSPEAGWSAFQANEKLLENVPLRKMSTLTEKMLGSIDYQSIAENRRRNFRWLMDRLHTGNKLQLPLAPDAVPLAYPYLTEDPGLRQKLIDNRIFVPKYWPGLEQVVPADSLALYFSQYLLALPIDQRVDMDDLDRIISLIQ